MTADRLRTLLATGLIAAALASSAPARAQMTVFDPSNYSQNVLTAAHAAAGQQRHPEPAERGDVAPQPGIERLEPEIVFALTLFSCGSEVW
jgi:hypothetical protein